MANISGKFRKSLDLCSHIAERQYFEALATEAVFRSPNNLMQGIVNPKVLDQTGLLATMNLRMQIIRKR